MRVQSTRSNDARPVIRYTGSSINDQAFGDVSVNYTWNGIDFDGSNMAKNTVFMVVVSNPAYVTWQDTDIYNCPTNCFGVGDGQNGTPMAHDLFTNMKFHDSGHNWTPRVPGVHAIYANATYMNSTDIVFDHIEVYNNTASAGSDAVQAPYSYGCGTNCVSTDFTFRNSYFHDNTWAMASSGASASSGGPGLKIYNNVFAHNGVPSATGSYTDSPACALSLGYNTTTGFQIYNNTFYNNHCGGWPNDGFAVGYPGYGVQSGIDIRNNIFWQNGTNDAVDPQLTSTPGYIAGTNLQNVDPGFVNAAGGDFHLTASSPAINAGTALSLVTTDRDGAARPAGSAYDIGAYEYIDIVRSGARRAEKNLTN